jgi:hypothetical protein
MLEIRHRVLSQPARVWWAGFQSDTLRLQREGWELAAEEDVEYGRIRLMLRHREMRLYALTNETAFDYYRQHEHGARPLEFYVVQASPNFQVREMAAVPTYFAKFQQIDAQPQVQEEWHVRSIEDFKIFATPLVRTEELIVEPETVAAMLEKIRKMQAPEQARIRAKERLAAAREHMPIGIYPRQTFHAQILSISDHRKAA